MDQAYGGIDETDGSGTMHRARIDSAGLGDVSGSFGTYRCRDRHAGLWHGLTAVAANPVSVTTTFVVSITT
jgi:hypothetical protein